MPKQIPQPRTRVPHKPTSPPNMAHPPRPRPIPPGHGHEHGHGHGHDYPYPIPPIYPSHPSPVPPVYPQEIDYGPHPFVIDINKSTLSNENFRTTLWTGRHLQTTLMSIPVGENIGLEMHPNVDQFLRIEEGQALVMMGKSRNDLTFRQPAFDDFAIFVPAGTWHNIINTGSVPLKLYSIYAPPNHPKGAVHPTKAIAEKMEGI